MNAAGLNPNTIYFENQPQMIWLNGWVLVGELVGGTFKSFCSHWAFRYCASLEKRIPWHSGSWGA